MTTDRIFGFTVIVVALAYIASATQIQSGFLPDPVGPKTFPILVGVIMAVCGVFAMLRPDKEEMKVQALGKIALAVAVLVAYAYLLRPLGFLIPTALASGIISYQISPRVRTATMTGVGLSAGLFIIFKFALGLSLFAIPRTWLG